RHALAARLAHGHRLADPEPRPQAGADVVASETGAAAGVAGIAIIHEADAPGTQREGSREAAGYQEAARAGPRTLPAAARVRASVSVGLIHLDDDAGDDAAVACARVLAHRQREALVGAERARHPAREPDNPAERRRLARRA